MITKKESKKLIQKVASKIVNKFGFTSDQVINIYIMSYKDRRIKKHKIKDYKHSMGLSYNSPKGVDIILFWNVHSNYKELISTLYHELLHLKLFKLSNLVTINYDQAYKIEEDLVQDLEKALSGYKLRRNKKCCPTLKIY